jgi:hypothetical protein
MFWSVTRRVKGDISIQMSGLCDSLLLIGCNEMDISLQSNNMHYVRRVKQERIENEAKQCYSVVGILVVWVFVV